MPCILTYLIHFKDTIINVEEIYESLTTGSQHGEYSCSRHNLEDDGIHAAMKGA